MSKARTSSAHRRIRTLLIAGTAALGLAACAGPQRDLQQGRIAERVTADQAVVDLPPGGPNIVGVVQHNYATSMSQEIILGNNSHTDGQNVLAISMFGPVRSTTGSDNVETNDELSQSRIGAQMRAALPGVRMSVSPYYAQNRYGAFGYASGLSKQGDMCLYAWQRIRAPEHDATLFHGQGTIQIRLRFCASGLQEADLLQVMTGFTINSYYRNGEWNPYGDAPPAPEDLGRVGKPILPSKPVTTAPVLAPEPVAVQQPAVVRRVRRIVPAQDAGTAQPVQPPVNAYQDYGAVPPPAP